MTTTATHPYFTAKAAQFLTRAGAPGADVAPLAAWAEAAKGDDFRRGVLVGRDGSIVAECRFVGGPDRASAWYMTGEAAKALGVHRTEVGLARGALSGRGIDTVLAKCGEVTTGPRPRA